ADPVLGATQTGFTAADAATITLSATRAAGEAATTYVITPAASGAALSNYSVNYVNGTFTIANASLTVTADNKTKTYGAANPPLTVSYAGFVNGDTPASLGGTLSVTTTATAASAVGSYPITASGQTSGNYTIGYVVGALTVTKASLTVTADDKTKTYGAGIPALTVSYAGFVNGDTPASLGGTLNVTTTATAASAVGSYPITASGQTSGNYTIGYVVGALTVTKASLTITANSDSKTYGTVKTFAATAFSQVGLVNSDTITGVTETSTGAAASALASPPTYPIVASAATGTGLSNYTISYIDGTLTVNKASLTVTPANQQRQYSDPNPQLTGTVVGVVAGDGITASYSTTATPSSDVGNYQIVATLNDPSNKLGNYAVTNNVGTLTVMKEDAYLEYTGDTIGLTGTSGLTLRATVWDSAASGSGMTGDATIGDITKMYIQFDIYTATSCGTGTPTTKVAPVSDTGTLGDGIGTATAQYSSSSEASYCV